MPTVNAVTEIILYVEDMDRMVSFYQDAFGLDISGGDPDHGFVRFETGACDLCLHAGREGPVGEFAPKVVFGVDDLEAAREDLTNYNVELGDIRSPAPDTRVVDGLDPEGNKFSIEAHTVD